MMVKSAGETSMLVPPQRSHQERTGADLCGLAAARPTCCCDEALPRVHCQRPQPLPVCRPGVEGGGGQGSSSAPTTRLGAPHAQGLLLLLLLLKE